MSDVSQGPGWWQASDLKWYPPHLSPGAAQPAPAAEAAAPSPSTVPGLPVASAVEPAQAAPTAPEASPAQSGSDEAPPVGTPFPGAGAPAEQGWLPPGDASPGYGAQPAYGAPGASGAQPTYGAPGASGAQPAYGATGAYGATPAQAPYGAPYGYATVPGAQPAYGYAVAAGPKTNGLAIASLVLSIFCLFGIGSVLGIVFGFVGRSQIKRSSGGQTGQGLALAGIIIGFVTLAACIFLVVISVVAARHAITCGNNGTCGN